MKTFTAKPADISHEWYVVDAEDVPLGRLASRIAQLIRGKHKPTYTPHMDGGDFVIVVNASKVRLTGRKETNKVYFRHTGYMGHERFTQARDLLAKHPERVIEKAVYELAYELNNRPTWVGIPLQGIRDLADYAVVE
jgi:large subunit ribosomal protein L13